MIMLLKLRVFSPDNIWKHFISVWLEFRTFCVAVILEFWKWETMAHHPVSIAFSSNNANQLAP